MRLAVIADIHGNVLALDAVLDDIGRRGADKIVNLGDCVSGPLWPRETCERLMPLGLATVRGNHDRWVAGGDPAAMGPSDRYAFDALDAAARAWLGALPTGLTLEAGGVTIRAFHARPADDNNYLAEEIVAGRLALVDGATLASRLGEAASAGLVLCGHSHQPRLLRIAATGAVLVNPGSVGAPAYDDPTPPQPHVSEVGSPHARYAMVSVEAGVVTAVEMIAIGYDWRAAAERAAAHGRPEWAHALATGFMA